jgi:hypothetical protein
VLLAYRVPRVPSTPRIAIWRKLRTLGVAQIGDGLVALPEDARTREQLEWIAGDVDAAGGSASLWRGELLSVSDEDRLVAQLQEARAEEYRALVTQVEQASIDMKSIHHRAVHRLRRELRRIRRRDYFPPAEQELARAAIESLVRRDRAATPTASGEAI